MQISPLKRHLSGSEKSECESGIGYNVFVANFGGALDNRRLYKLFEKFGPISNALVMNNAKGPLGYGFVEFEREGDAENAIWAMSGRPVTEHPNALELIVRRDKKRWGTPIHQIPPPTVVPEKNGDKIAVVSALSSYYPLQQRAPIAEEIAKKRAQFHTETSKNVYGVYVANFGDALDNRRLFKLFEKFGPISTVVMKGKGNEKKTLGFGFVRFEREGDAENAIREMAGAPVPGLPEAIKLIVKRDKKMWGTPFHQIPPHQYSPHLLGSSGGGVNAQMSSSAAYVSTSIHNHQQQGFHYQQVPAHQHLPIAFAASFGFIPYPPPSRVCPFVPPPGSTIQQQNFVPSLQQQSESTLPIADRVEQMREGKDHWVEVSGRSFREEVLANRAHYEVHFRVRFGAKSIGEIRLAEEDCPDRIQLNFASEALANEAVKSLNNLDNQIYPVKIRATRWFPFDLNLNELAMQLMANKIPPQKEGIKTDDDMSTGKILMSAESDSSHMGEKAYEQKKSLVNSSESNKVGKDPKNEGNVRATSSASYQIRSDIRELEMMKVRGMALGSTTENEVSDENEDPFRLKASRLLLAGDNQIPESLEDPMPGVGCFGRGNKFAEQSLSAL